MINIAETRVRQSCLISRISLVIFLLAILMLVGMNISQTHIMIQRPFILLFGLAYVLFDCKKNRAFLVIEQVILLYMIEFLFKQLSERFFHFGVFSIQQSLLVMILLSISFMYTKIQRHRFTSTDSTEYGYLLRSWGGIFGVILVHMLFLFTLLKSKYGYGYEYNISVLANMCMYFLVFIFTWEKLENVGLRRITAIILAVFLIVILARGSNGI